MRKINIILLFILSLFVVACDNQSNSVNENDKEIVQQELLPNKIYFFYQNSCPHCHDAADYIFEKYKDLPIVSINIANAGSYDLFMQCVKKFNLGTQVGTPLFCISDKYIMGWSVENKALFDIYVKDLNR